MELWPLFLTLSGAQFICLSTSSANPPSFNWLQGLSLAQPNWIAWHFLIHLLLDLCYHQISYLMIMVICLPSPLCCTFSLHQCIWYDPLAYIIQLLLAVSPKSLSHGSCLHGTPLYIAVGTHVKLSIMQLLADAYPAACSVQNMDDKTLLILVCDSSCALFENDCQETIWDPPSIKLIRTFIKAYPTSLLLEDHNGTSALKHDILRGVHWGGESTSTCPCIHVHKDRGLVSSEPLKVVEGSRTIPGTLSWERNIK